MSPLLIGKLLHTGWPRGYRLERYSFIRSFCTARVLQVGGAIGWTMCWQICTQLCEPMNPAMLGTWGFVVIGNCKKGTMVQQCMRSTFAVFTSCAPCTLHPARPARPMTVKRQRTAAWVHVDRLEDSALPCWTMPCHPTLSHGLPVPRDMVAHNATCHAIQCHAIPHIPCQAMPQPQGTAGPSCIQ